MVSCFTGNSIPSMSLQYACGIVIVRSYSCLFFFVNRYAHAVIPILDIVLTLRGNTRFVPLEVSKTLHENRLSHSL